VAILLGAIRFALVRQNPTSLPGIHGSPAFSVGAKLPSFLLIAANLDTTHGPGGDWLGRPHLLESGLAGDARKGQTALLRSVFWLPKEWELALNHRNSALLLNGGYPLTLDEEIDFTLPPRSKVTATVGPAESSEPPLKWKIEWKKSGDAKLRATLHAELSHGELSVAEIAAFQRQLRSLMNAVGSESAFSHPETKIPGSETQISPLKS